MGLLWRQKSHMGFISVCLSKDTLFVVSLVYLYQVTQYGGTLCYSDVLVIVHVLYRRSLFIDLVHV